MDADSLERLKNGYGTLQGNNPVLNTIAKMQREDYARQLRQAFAKQTHSIQRMHQGMVEGGGSDRVWSQEEFVQRIKDHERQVN